MNNHHNDNEEIIKVPFSQKQIDYFNNVFQKIWHWYTCCSPKDIEKCFRAQWIHNGDLIAEKDWLICPCGEYKQDWFI